MIVALGSVCSAAAIMRSKSAALSAGSPRLPAATAARCGLYASVRSSPSQETRPGWPCVSWYRRSTTVCSTACPVSASYAANRLPTSSAVRFGMCRLRCTLKGEPARLSTPSTLRTPTSATPCSRKSRSATGRCACSARSRWISRNARTNTAMASSARQSNSSRISTSGFARCDRLKSLAKSSGESTGGASTPRDSAIRCATFRTTASASGCPPNVSTLVEATSMSSRWRSRRTTSCMIVVLPRCRGAHTVI